MSIRSELTDALPGIFDDMGEAAVYTPLTGTPVDCFVFLDFGVNLEPDALSAQAWQTSTVVEVLLSDIDDTEPNRGDTFLIDSVTYTVQRVIFNDSFTVKMAVK